MSKRTVSFQRPGDLVHGGEPARLGTVGQPESRQATNIQDRSIEVRKKPIEEENENEDEEQNQKRLIGWEFNRV
jgi:hypothetical protein